MILCSDGLSDEVGDEEMADVMRYTCSMEMSNQEIADALINVALRNGGCDNVTVIVISVQ